MEQKDGVEGAPEELGESVTFRLQIEVRMKHGKKRNEIWRVTRQFPKSKELTVAEFMPWELSHEGETPFGAKTRHVVSFDIESIDTEKRVITSKLKSFARSEWFYQNIQNFGFECEVAQSA